MTTHVQTGLLANELLCPHCQHKGLVSSHEWRCGGCQQLFDFDIRCDGCKEVVQRLTGCGCSEHFYCRTCKTPKSRKAVLYEMTDTES